jgi:hypothetical protein
MSSWCGAWLSMGTTLPFTFLTYLTLNPVYHFEVFLWLIYSTFYKPKPLFNIHVSEVPGSILGPEATCIIMVSLNHFWHLLQKYLQIRHKGFFPHPSQFIIQNYPTVKLYIGDAADKALLN